MDILNESFDESQIFFKQFIFFKHLFILYPVQAYKILLHFVPHTPIWIPIYERIRHQWEKNKIHFCSLRITAFQIYKMTDWHFHATHQIPILSVLKAALQLVWKRLSLDVQTPPPPPGSRVQYYLRDTLISFCIKELSCQTGQWIQPNVWLWLWKWERADHCAR